MITLSRLNHQDVIVNASHIVSVESIPDTLVTLYGGDKLLVRETPQEVVERVVQYHRRIGGAAIVTPLAPAAPAREDGDGAERPMSGRVAAVVPFNPKNGE